MLNSISIDDLWQSTLRDRSCKTYRYRYISKTQSECQKKCFWDTKCAGIAFKQYPFHKGDCYLCSYHDLYELKFNPLFGFYRKPGKTEKKVKNK